MQLALGIDTGGTYTDAVIYDQKNDEILISHKALTTHHNLALGIENAISGVLTSAETELTNSFSTRDIALVGLSTTLATNAIVEGQGSPICLILIGYDADFIHAQKFEKNLVTNDILRLLPDTVSFENFKLNFLSSSLK